MKNQMFARPNLKLFAIAALLLLVANGLVTLAESADRETGMLAQLSRGLPLSDSAKEELINDAHEEPTAENFFFLSDCLRAAGDLKGAMLYLKKGAMAIELEEEQIR